MDLVHQFGETSSVPSPSSLSRTASDDMRVRSICLEINDLYEFDDDDDVAGGMTLFVNLQ